jgi:chemotaxis protein methyltransferase CheR
MSAAARHNAVDFSDINLESSVAQREFEFSDTDFRHLVQLAYEHAGIALSDSKRNLVYSRLSRRLRALNMNSFREYRGYLTSSDGTQEIVKFINAISTDSRSSSASRTTSNISAQMSRRLTLELRGLAPPAV